MFISFFIGQCVLLLWLDYHYSNIMKDRVINFEIPPADHLTKKFILNPVEDSRSAPTRISNQNQSVMG